MNKRLFHLSENLTLQKHNALRINAIGLIAPVIPSSFYFFPGNYLDTWQVLADSDLQESPLGFDGRMP